MIYRYKSLSNGEEALWINFMVKPKILEKYFCKRWISVIN